MDTTGDERRDGVATPHSLTVVETVKALWTYFCASIKKAIDVAKYEKRMKADKFDPSGEA